MRYSQAIQDVKDKTAERAQERYEAEQTEYEQKLEQRREREATTGKTPRGRPPQKPEAGPKDQDQVNFTDERPARLARPRTTEILPGHPGTTAR